MVALVGIIPLLLEREILRQLHRRKAVMGVLLQLLHQTTAQVVAAARRRLVQMALQLPEVKAVMVPPQLFLVHL